MKADARSTTLDVDHVEGHVPNVLTVLAPHVVQLDERKHRYDARFVNRFEPEGSETRYTVIADITLKGFARALRGLARPLIRARLRRFVLDPVRRAVEAEPGRAGML